MNGHEAKPAKEIKTGDIVTLKFSSRTIDLEIMYTRAAPSQHALHEAPYRVMSETRVPKDKDPWTKDLS